MGILDFLKKEKSVPAVSNISEATRHGMQKAYIPMFLYKPPFGYPRYVDLPTIRRLAAMPYVEMCISTIIDEMCQVEWNLVPIEGKETTETESHIEQIENFFENPNTNKESFENIRRKYLRDILEIDAGIINKVFNLGGQMVEIVARDGATFTKNPDIYGMMTDRDDLIIDAAILPPNKEASAMAIEPGYISAADARERAAYFQYGWISGARPVPFGKKEIVWLERNPRTDSIYGRAPVQVLAETIQTLIYAIEHNLEYFNDNSIPKGVFGLDGANSEEVEAFKEQWIEQQRKKDSAGNWKKDFHNIPVVGKTPNFVRFQFTNSELELLEGQKWWAKLVWACFGVTSVELGYTEDAKGLANQIVQSNVFKKRCIYPLLRLEEYHLNKEILSEFEFEDVRFEFNLFDVEEETKKANLHKIWLDAKLRSINEIRSDEGLEDVEWGKDPNQNQGLGQFPFDKFEDPLENEYQRKKKESELTGRTDQEKKGGPGSGPRPGHSKEEQDKIAQEILKIKKKIDSGEDPREFDDELRSLEANMDQETADKINYGKIKQEIREKINNSEKKDIETKPFGEYADFDACVRANKNKNNPEAYCAELHKKITGKWPSEKAMQTIGNPLILRENEVIDDSRLERSIVYLLRQNEKKIKELIEKEIGKNTLKEIKSVDDIIKAIKGILTFEGIKLISDEVIKNTFTKGWDSAEKQLDQNILVNREALDYIQDYTFANIKNMTEEIANDLRAELQRGIMEGEGIQKIKARVSKVFDVGETRAEAISRTETARSEGQGRLQAFRSSGEKLKKRIVIAHDDRTSALCKRLEGQTVGINEKFKDSKTGEEWDTNPFHVNCRSSVVYLSEDEE